jgi:predicted porin
MRETMKRFTALLAALAFAPAAYAADLSGSCCSDLEERIAELEATAARKGNRKVSLSVYGQVNAGIMWTDVDGSAHSYFKLRDTSLGIDASGKSPAVKFSGDEKKVFDNPVSESRFGLRGEAKVREDLTAGFLMEIGVGDAANGFDDLTVRHAAWFLRSALGTVTVGRTSSATDDIDTISTANIGAAVKMLSAQPTSGYYLGTDLPFDGGKTQLVRYETPTIAGFIASGAWASEDDWDVALRHAGEFGGFRVAGGAGFRVEAAPFGGDDVQTWLVNGSVMHIGSGLFLNAAYGDFKTSEAGAGFSLTPPDYDITATGWHLLGGIETKLSAVGKTTVFAEYADLSGDRDRSYECFGVGSGLTCATNGDASLKWYGLGVVQAIEAAAMDIYITGRKYEASAQNDLGVSWDDGALNFGEKAEADVFTIQGGARIRF